MDYLRQEFSSEVGSGIEDKPGKDVAGSLWRVEFPCFMHRDEVGVNRVVHVTFALLSQQLLHARVRSTRVARHCNDVFLLDRQVLGERMQSRLG